MAVIECVDAGLDNCPCYLAGLEECVSCSFLQGESFCDCCWKGTCVYLEYAWSGFQLRAAREGIAAEILSRKMTGDLLIVILKVPLRMLKDLREPGSYVFLRGCASPSFFDVPISVMYVDDRDESAHFAVMVKGPKTRLLESCRTAVCLRGPYRNGLFGLRWIKQTRRSACLVVVSGSAQASSVLVIDQLQKNGNDVTLLIDKSSHIFIREYIGEATKVFEEELKSETGKQRLRELVSNRNITLIYGGGCRDMQIEVLHCAAMYNPDAHVAISNNSRLCCGEGVCGSCEVDIDGQKVRGCKVQFDVRRGCYG